MKIKTPYEIREMCDQILDELLSDEQIDQINEILLDATHKYNIFGSGCCTAITASTFDDLKIDLSNMPLVAKLLVKRGWIATYHEPNANEHYIKVDLPVFKYPKCTY